MKSILLLVFAFISFNIFAQEYEAEIRVEKIAREDGNQPAYVLSVKKAKVNVIDNQWQELVKEHGSKLKSGWFSKTPTAEEFTIPGTEDVVTIITNYTTRADYAELISWFQKPDGTYLDESYENKDVIYQMYNELADNIKKASIKNEIEVAEDQRKELEKKLKDLKKDKQNLEDDIKDCKEDIVDAEREVDGLLIKKEALVKELNEPAGDGIQKELDQMKDMRKELKSIEKDIEGELKDIEKCKKTIKESEAKIPLNVKEQMGVAEQIEKQNELLNEIKKRLNKI